jgi:hypothetical protein
MFTAGHPEDDVLEKYAMAKLEEPMVEEIEEHILICASCQDRLDFTETYLRSMKCALASAQTRSSENPWRSRMGEWSRMPSPMWVGVVAVVLLAIGGTFGTQYFTHSGPPIAVALSATRGETASIAATGPLDMKLDARDLASTVNYRVQIVNADGRDVWHREAASIQDGSVHILVNGHLARGQYFVRLFAPDAGITREFALQLR